MAVASPLPPMTSAPVQGAAVIGELLGQPPGEVQPIGSADQSEEALWQGVLIRVDRASGKLTARWSVPGLGVAECQVAVGNAGGRAGGGV